MLLWLAIGSAALVIYAVYARPFLRGQPWAQGFFALVEPIETFLFKKSETILLARTKMLLGLLLTILTQAGNIDITPLMPLVPDNWEPILRVIWNMIPMIITVVGWFDQQLRYDTTKPVEMVALPQEKTPEQAAVVAKAEEATAEVKAIVKEEVLKAAA